jgi:putative transposase
MPHTYCTNLVHRVFSTKDRADLISENLREYLYAYIFGIGKNLKVDILSLGGTANHVHILMALPAKQPLSFAIRDLKANSSRWMSANHPGFSLPSWQASAGPIRAGRVPRVTVCRY